MRASVYQRGIDKVAALAAQATDLVSLWHESTEVVAEAVPHYQAPCWYTVDPASLLITSHFHDGLPEFPPEWLAGEYYDDDDLMQIVKVIHSEAGMATLHEASGGDPSHTGRWARNMLMGGDQELIVRLRSKTGADWGAVALYRELGRPLFDESEKNFMQAIAPHLAEGARRALLVGEASDPEGTDAPGLLILTGDWQVESATASVDLWMTEFPDGDWKTGRLPSAVLAVAGKTLHPDNETTGVAVARVRGSSGNWIVLHGATLGSGESRRAAVIIEPAHPARIYPLLMSAYRLTDRERDVTRLTLLGNSTTDIAQQLLMSTHTVQQHLKSIFDKTGVRSRRDLVGKVFFSHYEPRLRDNERRTVNRKPVRGGPYDLATSV